MDHDDARIGTLLSRRQALKIAASSGIMLAGAPWLKASELATPVPVLDIVASPRIEEGPFFVDKLQSRSDIRGGTKRPSVLNGTPIELEILVYRLAEGKALPLPKAVVDLWCCDTIGVYSGAEKGMNLEDTKNQDWLRGNQTTDAKGSVRMSAIIPGWYPGRTVHYHLKVRTFSEARNVTADFTSQLFFPQEFLGKILALPNYKKHGSPNRTNAQDGIYSDLENGVPIGSLMTLKPVALPEGKGYKATFSIGLTDTNFRKDGLEWEHFL